ncbi:MAG TPA: hypothetical protein VNL37_07785 [Candidatus Polarisedimenticolia bacterium]|nr:hypothetical protein [Candidatus Polarisedimenticolia bacterium]
MPCPRPRAAGLALALSALSVSAAAEPIEPRVAVATSDTLQGRCDAIDLAPPWTVLQNLEPLGVRSRLRYFYDRLYAINPSQDDIQVIDPATFGTLRTLRLDPGSSPEDILVVSPRRAYVTLYNATAVAILDPTNGAPRGSIDLSGFADGDGLPEMSMMARDGDRLFIQIQRIDRGLTGAPVRPSWLAVVDLPTETLLDVDPDQPGVQGVLLTGTAPSFRMHVDTRARRLFVSAPGSRLDTSGGIEEIDLDALQSRGFILSEETAGADLGGFVMVSPDAGYVVAHTDIVASSHLSSFTRAQGQGPQILMDFGAIDTLALDAAGAQLFFPDPFSLPYGVHVIDTVSDQVLTKTPLATGLPPWDLAVVRRTTPGEPRDLRVEGIDPAGGALALTYRPACGASDHNLVFGPLQDVGTYAYTGQVCGVGSSGRVDAFDPGAGSFFFLLVGTGDAGDEGSYGADGDGVERPENLVDQGCAFTQDLSFACQD